MKFHAALAQALLDNGITTLFGVAGDANLYAIDSFTRLPGCSFVSAAHESGAVLMALGYGAISGKLGVATVTHGPGLTNTVTALVEGVKARTPMLLYCGDTAAEDAHHPQKLAQREVVLASGAGFEPLRSPRTLAQDLAAAIRRAWAERRPIALNVPLDFLWAEVEYKPIVVRMPTAGGMVPTGDSLDEAVGIIAMAKRPIVLAGRGAMAPDAKTALLRLAERIQAPVATTLKAQNLFRGEYCNLGVFGTLSTPPATEAILQSDCIIAFGAGLNDRTSAKGSFLDRKRVVQCNAEPGEAARLVRPDVALWGDIAATADLIVHWLDVAEIEPSGYRDDELDRKLRAYSPGSELGDTKCVPAGTVDIRHALWRIHQAMPADPILVTDGGRFCGAAYTYISTDPGSFVSGLHSGSIGLGMGYAIGAGCADRSRPVLHVTGDGGFMLGGLTEFNTAVRHKLDMIVVMCNDGAYGAEHIQFRDKDMDPGLSTFEWPDFAPVAQALGGQGVAVRSEADLDAAAQAIQHRDRLRPLLIDLKLHPDHIPSMR